MFQLLCKYNAVIAKGDKTWRNSESGERQPVIKQFSQYNENSYNSYNTIKTSWKYKVRNTCCRV